MDADALQKLWSKSFGGLPESALSPGMSFKVAPNAPTVGVSSKTPTVEVSSKAPTVEVAPVAASAGSRTVMDSEARTIAPSNFDPSRSVTVAPLGSSSTARPSSPSPRPAYVLGPVLGRGGMGVVHSAVQESLGRRVAVKMLHSGGKSDLEARERFVAEARVTAGLDHPNVVPVHELARLDDGELVLAMKLVGGLPWSRLLHPTNDSERARAAGVDRQGHLEILRSVCQAVAFAHSRGLLHRDLKPENVMVGEFGEVLVMDWGLAASFGDDAEAARTAPHVSTLDRPAGTPCYMAPELAEGRGSAMGPWTNVYLLGAILHEILTGEPPHGGGSFWEVLVAASTSAPPQSFGASVPYELRAICAKALSRETSQRYPSVTDLRLSLEAFSKHRESVAISEAARKTFEGRRSQGARAGEASASYADLSESIAGFRQALVLWDGNVAAREGEVSARELYARTAIDSGDLGLASAQLSAMAPGPTRSKLESVVASALAARARVERTTRLLRIIIVVLVLFVVAGSTGAALWLRAANEELKKTNMRERLERRKQEMLRERAEEFIEWSLLGLGRQLRDMGRPDLEEQVNEHSKDYYKGLGDVGASTDAIKRRQAMIALKEGAGRQDRGDLTGALESYRRSLAIGESAKREDDQATAHLSIGTVLELQGDRTGARSEYDIAIELERKNVKALPNDEWWVFHLAHGLFQRASLSLNTDHAASALEDARAMHSVARTLLEKGPDDLDRLQEAANASRLEGEACQRLGDLPGAIAAFGEALAHSEKLAHGDPSGVRARNLAFAHRQLAFVLRRSRKLDDALEHCRKDVEVFRGLVKRDPSDDDAQHELELGLSSLGFVEFARGDAAAGHAALVEAIEIGKKLVIVHPERTEWGTELDQLVANFAKAEKR